MPPKKNKKGKKQSISMPAGTASTVATGASYDSDGEKPTTSNQTNGESTSITEGVELEIPVQTEIGSSEYEGNAHTNNCSQIPKEFVDGYDIEYVKKLPREQVSFSTEADVQGGETGREHVQNLRNTARQPWNKWNSGGALNCSVNQRIEGGAYLTKYALCSANDMPQCDPTSWTLSARRSSDGEWVTIHTVNVGDIVFTDRWQWFTFVFPSQLQGEYNEAQLVLRTHLDASCLQLGHWHFEYEAVF